MDWNEARVLVAGASGALGGAIARLAHGRGARLALGGRDEDALNAVAGELGGGIPLTFDARDPKSCDELVAAAEEELGGLDVLVISIGVPAFGPAVSSEPDVVEQLFAVNTLGPIHLIRARLRAMPDGGAIAVVSAGIADYPTAGLAAYSAAKAALAAYVAAVRREVRRDGIAVLDVRPHHMDTAFAERALTGEAPKTSKTLDHEGVAQMTVDALAHGKREIAYDLTERELVVR
jgi:short-subunit dehydrogenase